MCFSMTKPQMSEKKHLLFSQVFSHHHTDFSMPPAATFNRPTGEQWHPWMEKIIFFPLNSHCTLYMSGRHSWSGINHLPCWFPGSTASGMGSPWPDGWIQPTVLSHLAQLLVTGVFSSLLLDTLLVCVTSTLPKKSHLKSSHQLCCFFPYWRVPEARFSSAAF